MIMLEFSCLHLGSLYPSNFQKQKSPKRGPLKFEKLHHGHLVLPLKIDVFVGSTALSCLRQ